MKNILKRFTLIELLIVIAIIAILAAVLLPALNSGLEKARTASCVGNQKQIYTAMAMYMNDFDAYLPPPFTGSTRTWALQLLCYLNPNAKYSPTGDNMANLNSFMPLRREGKGIFICPSAGKVNDCEIRCSYVISSDKWNEGASVEGIGGFSRFSQDTGAGRILPKKMTKTPSGAFMLSEKTVVSTTVDRMPQLYWISIRTTDAYGPYAHHAGYTANFLAFNGSIRLYVTNPHPNAAARIATDTYRFTPKR